MQDETSGTIGGIEMEVGEMTMTDTGIETGATMMTTAEAGVVQGPLVLVHVLLMIDEEAEKDLGLVHRGDTDARIQGSEIMIEEGMEEMAGVEQADQTRMMKSKWRKRRREE